MTSTNTEPDPVDQPLKQTKPRRTTGARLKAKKGAPPATRTPKRGAPRKYDWEAIGKTYVEGLQEDDGNITWLNLRELSERYSVPYTLVRENSARDRWSEQRSAYQIQAAQERKKKRLAKLADNAVDFDEKSYQTAKIGIGLITKRLGEIMQEAKVRDPIRAEAFDRLSQGEPVERQDLWSAINYREMDGLARAARTFQEMGQRALGTDVQKVDVTANVEGEVTHVHSVREEMLRDDTERLTAVVEALAITDPRFKDVLGSVLDAEVVDDDNEPLEIEASVGQRQEASQG